MFKGWALWSAKNWGKAFLVILGLTVVFSLGFTSLDLELTFYNILPNDSSQVEDIKKIAQEFPYASAMVVAVDGRSIEDPDEAEAQVKGTVDALVAKLSTEEFTPYVSRVLGSFDQSFFEDHGLLFTEPEDIQRFRRIFADLSLTGFVRGLNDDFEREYSGQDDNLADDESEASARFRALGQVLDLYYRAALGDKLSEEEISTPLDQFLIGDNYLLSRDRRMGIVYVKPTFTIEDIYEVGPGVNAVEEAAKSLETDEVKLGLTGMTTVMRDEVVTSEAGLVLSSSIALILILLLMILVFRMFSGPLIAGLPLVLGILWATGLTGMIVQRLNIVTAMYMVALLGLGIDFAIHILSTYIQEKDAGKEFFAALGGAFEKISDGLLTGALTTAAAFFSLNFAGTSMVRELGAVAGLGILSQLMAMILLIPALLGFRHWRKMRKAKAAGDGSAAAESGFFQKVAIRSDLAGGLGKLVVKAPLFLAISLFVSAGVLAYFAQDVEIETNLMAMEAKGLESVHLQDVLVDEFGLSVDGLQIIVQDPLEVKRLTEELEDLATVKSVESLGPFILSDEDYAMRTPELLALRTNLQSSAPASLGDYGRLAEEIERLGWNYWEMNDMAFLGGMSDLSATMERVLGIDAQGNTIRTNLFDQFAALDPADWDLGSLRTLEERFSDLLRERLLQLANPEPVGLEALPSYFTDSFRSEDGRSYLLSVSPTANPWRQEFRDVYTDQVETVTDKGTGMILVGDQLTRLAEEDGMRASVIALIAVFLILLLDFRNFKLTLLTMAPLLLSFLSLFGIMALSGLKFDFVNIIVVPLIIGIGIDDAVHVSHRYRLEGKGNMLGVLATTGTALLITTLTTIIGFASFIPSLMEAMKSTGIVLSVAMGLCFIFSVLFHPSVLILVSEKLGWNLEAWSKRPADKTA
jgi:predicted RND superfamily exporter protein